MLVPERGSPETTVVKSRMPALYRRGSGSLFAMQQRTLEVPIDSIEGARLAAPFATRLEVCHDLSSEGWTPRMELLRACREVVEGTPCTLVSMIRPEIPGGSRALDVGAFTATPRLVDACMREVEASAKAGAHSVAVSLLSADGHIDMDANARLIELARGFGLVVAFLRTFDLLVDRERGMRDIAALGFTRFITAGVLGWDASVATLSQRIEVVGRDIANSAREAERLGRAPVEVVPAGGVRASNAQAWLGLSPHLHASCRRDGVISREELELIRGEMR